MHPKSKRNRRPDSGNSARKGTSSSLARFLPRPEAGNGSSLASIAVSVMLVLCVALVFAQSTKHDFVTFDDANYVSENPHVAKGITASGVAWAFMHFYASNWHPVTWLSHMLDCQIFGSQRAGGHHMTNVMLHAMSSVTLFLVFRAMTRNLWPSAMVAALFAIHPLHVESVSWVAERKDVLSGLFFVLTLACYLTYVRHPFSVPRYLLVTFVFALGLMSKPMLVTLPFVLVLLDYWPLARFDAEAQSASGMTRIPIADASRKTDHGPRSPNRQNPGWVRKAILLLSSRTLLEKVPWLAMSAVSCAATRLAQRNAIVSSDAIPLPWRLANAAVAYATYLRQFFCPSGLAVFYPHPRHAQPAWTIVGAMLLLAFLSASVIALRRKYPYLIVGWLWYCGMLVPVVGLVQVGLQAMADRYAYLPQIGLYLALAWGSAAAVRKSQYAPAACGFFVVFLLSALVVIAWQQASRWRDSETLWRHALACTSQNEVAHNNLGVALVRRGKIDLAVAEYQAALAIRPNYVEAHNNLGIVLHGQGQEDDAIVHFRQALEIDHNSAQAHNNLGLALTTRGQVADAIGHFQEALRINPEYAKARNNLGIVLARSGHIDEAVEQFNKALEISPMFAEARRNLDRIRRGQ